MNSCNNIAITPELIAQHGLKSDEYQHILTLIGREPTFTELGIFSAMWNEHCSYKSSKKWLKTLPIKGKCVIQGPGENAGVIDIGKGQCVVFKMESHNHPSYIEPYQGAATGMGGILRDVFTMGARPVAAMNALRFGSPNHPRTRHLVAGVVSGIGGYSNAFGVPTVGGEVNFDERYNGNILVNAFVAGIAKTDSIFYSKAQGVGLPVVYLGAKTGRDGVGGAMMASAEFNDSIDEKRPTVQVGDPFIEKCLLEACLELMELKAIVAIQDMGAAGLTSSAVEMGAKGNLGIQLNLDKVPTREENMTAYEIMLSESQERMLMVLKPELKKRAAAIFQKWGLHFSIIGKTTDDLRFRVTHQGEEVVNLPIKELGDEAPVYDRPWIEPTLKPTLKAEEVKKIENFADVLLKLLNSANQSSRRWVYEQYDTLIQGNTLVRPGGDAGVIRVSNNDKRALAFSCDVTPRYCEADPYEGGKQAVVECWRNISTTGATPLAATDNLNFGNPENPKIMGQLVFAIKGISEACRILDFPIVSGNVSLYNETNGEAILPTPTIAGVGLLDNWSKTVTIGGMQNKDSIVLIGPCGSHLGQSIYARNILNIDAGAPPHIDLQLEKKHGQFVRDVIHRGFVNAAHDISDGGLALALAEMVIKASKGIRIKLSNKSPQHAELFGEDQARYILAVKPHALNSLKELAQVNEISLTELGTVEGNSLNIDSILNLSIDKLTQNYESWFPQFMNEE
ncbi:phosphoribosylformylglycinamidine synthase subunit PurL [Bartonella quintana]|uniref:Phosphoribosylformylglycinamidine synthase subunit PurL n=1 Tax=Bartonella quintana JK 68 TaxID=1134503 RepID=A0ABR4SQY9_BARQI|nr:phosphoribosylformylglycinamidine synthase subunit PurL [Bartonella quintana]ETS13157.1 phosphoribosylformylglycinamidine synthase 2 [Bartonella quintana BQ2-D70]ETS17877.1 phosphoribosylformylglycinamidine synthase 2 [Bartonella quintana JK 7]ETS18706.1 phosphoribosylformylglycinamidine synthase 2 [Bartonella quintana JK 12]KEC62781.1 phosphoribosylformylglycinamidine synthase 2 [Bartonella quintana JK 63]KEC63361.1 phosphoribosylformylglycinamidine synthase 2 [Bartonella quintana JK 31]